jgi:hypothetical protein
MILTAFLRYRRSIALFMLPFVSILVLHIPATAQEPAAADETRGTNIKWTTKGDIIVVNYDLSGSPESKVAVSVVMKKEGDPAFSAVPLTVEGDVGEGFFAGTNKEIRWYYRRDYPQGFQGEGYYFEIHVQDVGQPTTWLYYVIGGAALTGGIIALLVSKNQNTVTPAVELPLPPDRPGPQ